MSDSTGKWREEISIEETNRIRASLGLKPLKVDNTPKESKQTAATATNTSNSNTNDIADTIKKLKQKREATSSVGKSIAEQLLEDGDNQDDDISTWVQRSRIKQQQQQKDQQKQTTGGKSSDGRSKRKSSGYSADDLAGIKVANQLQSFDDGGEHVLVLKDTDVLNDGDSELIDVRLAEKEKINQKLESSKKKSQYDKFDEYGKQLDILSHYDDDNAIKETGFIITNKSKTGVEDLTKKEDMQEEIRNRLNSYSAFDLSTESTIQSSFYTNEEMAKFKKPTSKKKKKKSMRSKNKDSDDIDILQQLDATTSSDRGSRKSLQAKNEIEEENQRAKREANYQKAVDKASNIAKLTYSSDTFEEAEDEEFYKSLSNAKKAPLIQRNIAEKVKEKENAMETNQDDNDLFISPVSEFVRGLKTEGVLANFKPTYVKEEDDYNEENQPVKIENQEDVEMQVDNDQEEEEEEEEEGSYIEKKADYNGNGVEKNKSNSATGEDGSVILQDEPMVSSSMSAALKLLIQKGELKPQEKSKRKLQSFDDYEPIIQHKDQFGRIMNRKEAFVAHSQIFHGKASGKNKQEKIQRKYNEEMKQKKMSSTDTPLGMMQSLQNYQEKTQQPFLVLSGKFSQADAPSSIHKSNTELSVKKQKQ
ncbi:SART-1 family protein [Heterostelium album PN500]|uniref:SART-1 family protein n=1 Tax=Heterostelium pallidum (strain ATCC 26659 / Pp 5 / PN500) TaxID=670386 RepID=D3BQA1_HETP5|nr:SART-1 family protein [Heterostelium album PN500]EFA76321.1 SART-1 family protein [Heterostelium album PN500]|eukprot:XP_020428453.1 SART-1 family protein [Heterostelium album PN500]